MNYSTNHKKCNAMKKVINFLKRFNWQEAKKVELETFVNLIITFFGYSFALVSMIALFFGAWWQLILGVPMYVLGAVCLNDTQWGNESALNYLHRVFTK